MSNDLLQIKLASELVKKQIWFILYLRDRTE